MSGSRVWVLPEIADPAAPTAAELAAGAEITAVVRSHLDPLGAGVKSPVAGQDFDLPEHRPLHLNEWAPIDAVAHVLGRSRNTIKTWAQSGAVRRQVLGAVVLVHVLDATHANMTRSRRKRLQDDRESA